MVGIDVEPAAAEALAAAGIEPRIADVTDAGSLSEAVEGAELVVHTAAFVHEGDEMWRVPAGSRSRAPATG